ncbi:IPT/TIG domain-containing protein [Candidatus Woesearchaeota archaeon]|nr:IPT/TIG domain-containing protein [Candidatus Woesearchaeota archaeon]
MKRGGQILSIVITIFLFLPLASSIWTDDYREVVTEYTDFLTGNVVHEPESSSSTTSSQRSSRTLPRIQDTILIRRPSLEQIIPSEPASSKPSCQITALSWSKPTAFTGETVDLVVTSQYCSGTLRAHLFERDFLVDDDIVLIEKGFTGEKTFISWKITKDVLTLFDEPFEEQQLEIYFQIESADSDSLSPPLHSSFLIVSPQSSSRAGQRTSPLPEIETGEELGGEDLGSSVYLGYGCTTAFIIDRDCDGYGNGGQDAPDELPPFGQPDFSPPLGKDANDFDPTLNTLQTARDRYGGLDSAQEFKNWIQDLNCLDIEGSQVPCYTHTLGNVYFTSPTGDDATGQVNNPNMPFRSVDSLRFQLQPGDVVVVREGYNSVDLGPFPCNPANPLGNCICNSNICSNWPNYFRGLILHDIDGTPSQPILIIAAPGERAWYNGYYSSMSFNANSRYVIVDGIEINGKDIFFEYRRSGLEFQTITRDITLRNMEFTRHPADIFGDVTIYLENVLFDSLVIHTSQGGQRDAEHGIYLNNPSLGDYHRNVILKDSLIYYRNRHGVQLRPPYINLKIIRNIIWGNSLGAIEIKGSIQNSEISNNLFFNNGRTPLLINRESGHEQAGPIDDVSIFQNTLWVGNSDNGMGESCWMSQGGTCQTNNPSGSNAFGFVSSGPIITMTNLKVANNVIYLTSRGSLIWNEWLPNMLTATIQNNFIYSTARHPTNPLLDLTGMMAACLILPNDGTHDYTVQNYRCTAPNNFFYYWSMGSFQNAIRPLVFNNQLIPENQLPILFTDVNPSYTYTSERFDFNPAGPTIATDNSLPTFNSLRDIRGNLRGSVQDAGAYEYGAGSTGPFIIGVNPSTAASNQNTLFTITGYNFDYPGARLELCFDTTCIPLTGYYTVMSSSRIQTNLTLGASAYEFQVRNLDDQLSNRFGFNVFDLPTAPSGLQVSSLTSSQVDLLWTDASTNEDGFYIERSLFPTSGFIQIGTNSANDFTFTDNTVTHTTTYYYKVRAFNAGGNSSYSNTVTVVVPSPPSCAAQNGFICANGYYCLGNSLLHSGSGVCCNIPCQEGDPSLVGHWKFDDTVGVSDPAIDSSIYNLPGTCASGACPSYLSASGQLNGAYDFDGTNDELTVADDDLLDLTTQGTIMAWIKRDSSKWHGIIAKGNVPNHAYEIEVTPGNRFNCRVGGGNFASSTTTIAVNTYYHIACTWNAGTLRLYVNGVLEQTVAGIPNAPANSGALHIGSWPPASGPDWDWMDGKIDDVRIYNRGLSASEIQTAMGTSTSFDFTMAANPTSGTVRLTNSIQSTITATQVSGSGSVTFSASNLPSGVLASFNPSSCTPTAGTPCSTTMTLTASSTATLVNNQQVSVTGTSGTTIRNTPYSLSVVVCTSGQIRACGLTQGVCQGATETCTTSNIWPVGGCTTTIYQNHAQATYGVNYQVGSETLCDGQDNNCNGQTDDIQSQFAPLCLNQVGVCAGARQSCGGVSGWQACGTTQYQNNNNNYQTTEVNRCTNTLDDDCDGRADHAGPRTAATPPDGDQDCAVGVTAITASATICPGTSFTVTCTATVGNVPSIQAFLGAQPCIFQNWNSNIASFTCTSQATAGQQTARCTINPQYSYQSGTDPSRPVTVGGTNCCNQYNVNAACEGDTSCDWCLGCSGTQSSGGATRCVQAGSCTYACTQGQCGAACSANGGCTQTQTCASTTTCGCTEENPRLTTISPFSINLAILQPITLTGQYFAANAEVRVDGITVIPSRIISRTSTQIVFQYQIRDYGVGQHQVTVFNPTSGRTSMGASFTITALPRITSLNPPLLMNNQFTTLDIQGQEFDPIALVIAGQFYQGAWTSPTHQLIQAPNIPPGVPPGDYSLVVVNRDLVPSNSVLVSVRQPFTFALGVQPSTATVVPNTQLPVTLTLTGVPFSTSEQVTVSTTAPTGITAAFQLPQGNSCTPNPTCQLSLSLGIGNVLTGQSYIVDLQATSSSAQRLDTITLNVVQGQVIDCTNGIRDNYETDIDCGGPICAPAGYLCDYARSCALPTDCRINQGCGIGLCTATSLTNSALICQPDSDCDTIPDSRDRCLTTPASVVVSLRNGCPLPRVTSFSPSLTTDFTQVEDLEHVQDLSLGIVGVGRLQYPGREISVLRIVNNIHQALDLDTEITLQPNLIGLDSTLTSEFNYPATLIFSGLTSTTAPTPLRDGLVCSSLVCVSQTYANGDYTVTVPGFSEYSTQPGTCGDTYCNLDESCSLCSQDCGACPPGGSSSGGSGGGNNANQRVVVDLDTNIQQTVSVLRNSRISVIYQGQEYGVRVPHATAEAVILTVLGDSYSIPLGQRLGIDLSQDSTSDANIEYVALDGNVVTLTFSRLIRERIPTLQDSSKEVRGPLTPHYEETSRVQENQQPPRLFSTIWVRIPLVFFVLALAFYFRYVRLRRIY